jgi:purine-binding chemotaxis protein CheW
METNKQYFLFISNSDIYAIEALDVIEIVEYQNITKVPMMSDFVKGVTNIRGNIIAVIDLLQRFGLEETNILDKTSLVILKKRHLDKELQIAIIIDEVFEVDNISSVNIEHTPSFGTRIDKKFIKSMAKYDDEFVPILDIDAILNIDEISVLTA